MEGRFYDTTWTICFVTGNHTQQIANESRSRCFFLLEPTTIQACTAVMTCPDYNIMHILCEQRKIHFIDVQDDFSTQRDSLWCWDGVHLSDTDGAPLLIELVQESLTKIILRPDSSPLKGILAQKAPPVPHISTKG